MSKSSAPESKFARPGSISNQDLNSLENAPTGDPMRAQHWIFLLISGVALPILILWWGWV